MNNTENDRDQGLYENQDNEYEFPHERYVTQDPNQYEEKQQIKVSKTQLTSKSIHKQKKNRRSQKRLGKSIQIQPENSEDEAIQKINKLTLSDNHQDQNPQNNQRQTSMDIEDPVSIQQNSQVEINQGGQGSQYDEAGIELYVKTN